MCFQMAEIQKEIKKKEKWEKVQKSTGLTIYNFYIHLFCIYWNLFCERNLFLFKRGLCV